MAIVIERIEGSDDLIKTYSDEGMKIQQNQTGIIYDEAIDVDWAGYTYTEIEEPIIPPDPPEPDPMDDEIDDSEAMDIIFGGDY